MASKSEQEYNKNRRLHLLNLPPSTEGEIKEFLTGIKVKDVQLNAKLDSAIVNLHIGNQVDEAVSKFNGKQFKDNVVVVKAATSDKLMCIAHFPLSYTDQQFQDTCKKMGPVKYAYIMQTEKSGQSKGYGLVEFDCDLEKAKSIKSQMDWMEMDGHIVHADFLDESVQGAYQELRSRCLFVTGMPDTFIDITKMREIFGCVTSPVYCQIVAKDEKSLGFGIVEFLTVDEAEATWFKLKDQKIEGNTVAITFCIPGKSAVVINNRIVWKYADKLKKNSLLPDPVNTKPVIGGHPLYISLIKMNPKLAVEFTAVLAELQQAYISQKMAPADKPGLLGPAPSLPLSPVMNPNMQLGLIVMLAMAIQSAKKEPFSGVLAKQLNTLCEFDGGPAPGPKPSILGDPITGQANVILTSLKQQLNEIPIKGDNGLTLVEPSRLDDKLRYINKKFVSNGRHLSCSQLANLGQLLVNMHQMALDLPSKPAGGGGLLSTPAMGPSLGKGNSLLGPVPGALGPLLGNNMNDPPVNKGSSLLGDAPNMPGKPQSLLGMGPPGKQQPQQQHQQQQQQQQTNQAIVQAMGLGIGASGMNNLSQTLLGQISQGLVHQIGQNLMYQLSVNQGGSGQSGTGSGSGKGLLGDIPVSQGSAAMGGGVSKGKLAGKSSLLGEPPSQFKNSAQGGQTSAEQGSWRGNENRWGSSAGYESGYSGKSGMTGSVGGGYSEFGGGYGESYHSDMGSGGGGGYGGGYGSTQGGFSDGDFYSTYQQYASNFGSGGGFGAGSGSNSMGGSGHTGTNFGGMGQMGSGGLAGNQASGVNFQDGHFGKGASSTGHGQDSGRYGGVDGFGGNMGGYGNYSMMGRDDMGDGVGHFDSYGTSNMGNSYSDGMGMTSGGGGMVGMGGGSNSMGMGGSGSGMGGSSNSMGMGAMGGYGSNMSSQMSAYSTGMTGLNAGSSSGAGNSGNSLLGSGAGGGLMDSMAGGGGVGSGYGSGAMGSLLGNSYGGASSMAGSGQNKSGMSAMGGRDQGHMGSSSYFSSGSGGGSGGPSGLLPSPAGKFNMSAAGQKRSYSHLMGKSDVSSAAQDYMSQGMGVGMGMGGGGGGSGGSSVGGGGLYADSFKRSRLY